MAIRFFRHLRDLFDTDLDAIADGETLVWDDATDKFIPGVATGGSGAPTTPDYLVGTAQAGLSAEIVVGAAPGGELGGTWASPTVDATHSGSTHAAVQAAAEATAAAALSAHLSDASDAHDASAVSVNSATLVGVGTDVQAVLEELDDAIAGAGAPTTADYLVGTAQGGLSAEIVVGTSPGGELGGTWASPTVDATHSGSTHAAVQAAAEATAAAALSAHLADATDAHDASAVSSVAAGNLAATDVQAALNELDTEKAAVSHAHAGEDITSGTVADARIAATITRDSELAAHEADTTSIHGITDTAALITSTTFNDHSARHENGGADEISIAGLDGTSTDLAAHLADASDAHDASAISADSTTLVGTGTDVQAVLEELDNGIADHLADTSAAHDATAIAFTPDGSIAATTVQAAIVEVRDEAAGGGAPSTADYLVGTAQGGLSAEIVVGTSPGGELGGTWAAPTVDATHSGSTHAAIQAAAEATAQAALDAHLTDATDAHDASAISIADAGSDFAATTVEGALDELQADHEADATALSDHIADATAAHAASAVSADSTTLAGTGTTVQAVLEELDDAIAAGGAPTTADYLVGTTQGGLSAEIVVGATPGGELGGTWASPTVDATHSGSSHAAVQAAAEATAAAALSAHLTDTSDAHDASAISADSTTLVGTGTDVQAVLEELDNGIADHLADATAAHAASAVSASSATLSGTGTDVQAVLEELDNLLDDHSARHENGGADEISIAGLDGTPTELATHLADASDAHDASAISILDAANDFTATEVEGALAELQAADEADEAALAAHIADATAAHAASAVAFTPAGTVAATTVQAAIEEVAAEGLTAAFSGAHVTNSEDTDITIPDSVETVLTFDTERYDEGGFHEGVTNPSRLTIPSDGKYHVGCNVRMNTPSAAWQDLELQIWVNGNDTGTRIVVANPLMDTDSPMTRSLRLAANVDYDFVAGDYVEAYVFQTLVTPASAVVDQSPESSPNFYIHKLSSGPAGPAGPAASVTLPTVVSVGAEFSGTGVPTATLPGTHTTNDILLLLLQSSNDSQVAAPAGYTRLGPQNGIGAAAAAGTTKLSIFWKRDGGSEVAPTIPDTGDHTYGVMLAIRGCPTVGDPFHLLGNAFKFTTSTTGTSPKGTTTIDNCLILDIFGQGVDNASAQGSSPTNADLTNVTEQFDDGTTDGTGGGIYVMSGTKAVAGDIVASTVTWANTTVDVSTRIAFIPADTTQVASSPKPTQIQTFIGSATDLDDLWVKPTGARRVKVQICDGGGSGSGGRSAATAAGGGGGGGGGYDEAEFNADELAATITVHAGAGAVLAAADAAGNVGVLSQFDKGGVGPLTDALRCTQRAAAAAITADGGNGGCGSGSGVVGNPPTVVTARIAIHDATAGAGTGKVGGRGGSGTTAPVGGSPSAWGGGGGESGADTDAAITSNNNGFSTLGAGGGSGGRTNTIVSGSGHGGGAAGVISAQGAAGGDSTRLPYGGSGGVNGGSTVAAGGPGGFPGGGGGGGGGVASGTGGRGGHGCVVVTTYF